MPGCSARFSRCCSSGGCRWKEEEWNSWDDSAGKVSNLSLSPRRGLHPMIHADSSRSSRLVRIDHFVLSCVSYLCALLCGEWRLSEVA